MKVRKPEDNPQWTGVIMLVWLFVVLLVLWGI